MRHLDVEGLAQLGGHAGQQPDEQPLLIPRGDASRAGQDLEHVGARERGHEDGEGDGHLAGVEDEDLLVLDAVVLLQPEVDRRLVRVRVGVRVGLGWGSALGS
eukprot:scaffold37055_cov39-Phaeocystis_antarctica.AAC.1